MHPDTREKLREAARRRNNCSKCGSSEVVERDGSECDGLPGICYRVCMGCGYTTAKNKRRQIPKEQL